jgi:hypothetical protein
MFVLLLGLAAAIVPAISQQAGQGGLKTVDNPTGGQFVYGSLTGQSSKANALVYMLHMVHTHFGDKPLIGKLLQSRDGGSLATFFTLNAKTMGGRPLAGLVIISTPRNGTPQAAVLYDDAKKFTQSEPSMMRLLTQAWQKDLGSSAGGGQTGSQGGAHEQAASAGAGSGQLYPTTGGDRSAMIKMPADWKLIRVAGGSLIADGSRGEMVMMGIIYQNIINPQSPQAKNLINGGMAMRGPKVICPLSSDLFSDYVCAFNQTRRNNGKSQGAFHFIDAQPQQAMPGQSQRPIVARFTVDLQDGMGVRNGSAYLGLMGSPGPGSAMWAMMASMSNIPQKFGSAVDPTLKAVVESYSQDANVIAKEGATDLERIHRQGEANQRQYEEINNRREANKQGFDNHMQALNANDRANDQHNADIDWQSKITQDYILDRSVIRDTDETFHATTGNNLAEALVKSNPNKLEYVPNQELIRGVDY